MHPIHSSRQLSAFPRSVWVRRFVLPAGLVAAAITAATCGSSTSTSSVTTGPTSAKCQITLTPSPNIVADGGTGSISVAAQPECEWTVSTPASWIEFSPSSGQGNGTIDVRVAPNAASSPREGEVVVNDSRIRVTQDAAPCQISVTPDDQTVGSAEGNSSVTVAAANGCAWTATSHDTWVSITSGANGSGNGTVAFRIGANAGATRMGRLTIAGHTHTVTQLSMSAAPPAGPCTYTVNPTAANVAVQGGTGTAMITTATNCAWTVSSNAPWLTVTSAPSGSGNGSVAYSIAANSGGARNGALTIGGQTLTISQAAAPSCAYSINPTTANVAAGAAAGSPVSVTTAAGCAWTASSNANWLTITSGANGNGSGSVGYNIAANTGTARNGTLTIAGQPFTVTQAAFTPSCTYSIDPTSVNVAAGAGAGPSVSVTATAGCAWTAASNAPWLTITAGASGNGNGTVGYNVAVNQTGSARNGTLTIAGRTFTVMQAAPAPSCNYSINPTSANVGAAGGAGPSVSVTTTAGCTWTATSNVPWISEMAGNRNGSGTVGFNVAANTGVARNGTLTIAGHTFTVMQASGCTFTIDPTSANFPVLGGNDNVRVTASGPNCAWTATTSAPWINITAGASDTGNGMVRFIVSPNTGAARNGTITIAGRPFTVTQNGVGGRLGGSNNDVSVEQVP